MMNMVEIDEEMNAVAAALVSLEWKKDSYLYYKWAGKDSKFLLSIILDRKFVDPLSSTVAAIIRFHSVDLNEFSNFIEQYHRRECQDIGMFNAFPLSLNLHLRGWNSLPLAAIDRVLTCGASDAEAFAQKCDWESKRTYEKYSDMEELRLLYEKERWSFSRDALIINLYMRKYQRVRDLFKDKFEKNSADMSHIIHYMDRYGLN